jgi:molybdate transport system substrate-binding protein
MTTCRRLPRALTPALALAVLLPALAACGGDDGGTTVTVYAASSLTKTFGELRTEFERTHQGVTVELVLGGSADLVSQLRNGADADVFASADAATMTRLTDDDLQGQDPRVFATNTLEIATPPDNPAGVTTLRDLAGDLDLVLCAPEVPCGAAARKVAEAAGLSLDPVSEEQSVADVLGKVTSGQADAGLVYRTDVIAAGDDVLGVEFPESSAFVNPYAITTVEDGDEPDLAEEFVDLVLSRTGQDVLSDAGFGAP